MMHTLKNKKGSTLTEYAVILGLISLVAWGAVSGLGVDAANIFGFVGKGAVEGVTAPTKGLTGAAKFGI